VAKFSIAILATSAVIKTFNLLASMKSEQAAWTGFEPEASRLQVKHLHQSEAPGETNNSV